MTTRVILTKELEKESAELKKYMGDFLEEKVHEFSETLKDKIGQFVNCRILSFYHTPSHDNTLFDQEGENILKGMEEAFSKRNWTSLLQEYQTCLRQKNRRCFHIQVYDSSYFFFEQCIVVTGPSYLYACSDDSGQRFSVFPHSLNQDMLRTLKHFQLFRPGNLEQGLTMYRVHPEFFHSKGRDKEFELFCPKEKEKEKEIQEIQEIQEKKKQLEMERQQLAEEKKKWMLVKQKMSRMRLELAQERVQFEKLKQEEWVNYLEEVD